MENVSYALRRLKQETDLIAKKDKVNAIVSNAEILSLYLLLTVIILDLFPVSA